MIFDDQCRIYCLRLSVYFTYVRNYIRYSKLAKHYQIIINKLRRVCLGLVIQVMGQVEVVLKLHILVLVTSSVVYKNNFGIVTIIKSNFSLNTCTTLRNNRWRLQQQFEKACSWHSIPSGRCSRVCIHCSTLLYLLEPRRYKVARTKRNSPPLA